MRISDWSADVCSAALKAEHDYRTTTARRFRLSYNPAAGIPTEPKPVGTRWLNADEFVRLYRWLECPDAPVHPPYTRAVRILMLTGQRVYRKSVVYRQSVSVRVALGRRLFINNNTYKISPSISMRDSTKQYTPTTP